MITEPVLPIFTRQPLVDLIRSMDFLSLEKGPWVCGGAALALARGKRDLSPTTADIDIFCTGAGQVNEVADGLRKLRGWGMSQRSTSQGALNFQASRSGLTLDTGEGFKFANLLKPVRFNEMFNIQIVTKSHHETLIETMDKFDFTVTMLATDGQFIVGPDIAWKHLRDRVLHCRDLQTNTLWRIPKYCEMGFVPSTELLREIIDEQVVARDYQPNRFRMMAPDGY